VRPNDVPIWQAVGVSNEFDPDQQAGPQGRSGPPWALIGLVIVAIVCAIFVFQNRDRTTVDILFFSFESSVWVAIALAMALGVLLDRFILGWWRRARKRGAKD